MGRAVLGGEIITAHIVLIIASNSDARMNISRRVDHLRGSPGRYGSPASG